MSFIPVTQLADDALSGRPNGGYSALQFGAKGAIGTTENLIYSIGTPYIFQTTAQTINLVSTSANDTSAGTGTRRVRITGIDASWNFVGEEIDLNGLTQVTTTTTFIRVLAIRSISAGSSVHNEGTISGTYSTTGDPAGTILGPTAGALGAGISQLALFTVPDGHILSLTGLVITAGKGKEAEISMWLRDNSVANPTAVKIGGFSMYEDAINPNLDAGLWIEERNDIYFTGITPTGTTTADVLFSYMLQPIP